MGKLIRRFLKGKYNHASISLDENFSQMYSFCRLAVSNPLVGGIIRESMFTLTIGLEDNVPINVYRIPVTLEQYELISKFIYDIYNDVEVYYYNFIQALGLISKKEMCRPVDVHRLARRGHRGGRADSEDDPVLDRHVGTKAGAAGDDTCRQSVSGLRSSLSPGKQGRRREVFSPDPLIHIFYGSEEPPSRHPTGRSTPVTWRETSEARKRQAFATSASVVTRFSALSRRHGASAASASEMPARRCVISRQTFSRKRGPSTIPGATQVKTLMVCRGPSSQRRRIW